MSVGEYCSREVIVISKDESVQDAVLLMRQHHVGDVVVVENRDGAMKPVGILTDRDIVIELLAQNMALDTVRIGDVMSYELATINENSELLSALDMMKSKGVRRLPVTNQQGNLMGILTLDDLLELVAEQLNAMVNLNQLQKKHEMEHRH